jgi:hypothetical protein
MIERWLTRFHASASFAEGQSPYSSKRMLSIAPNPAATRRATTTRTIAGQFELITLADPRPVLKSLAKASFAGELEYVTRRSRSAIGAR